MGTSGTSTTCNSSAAVVELLLVTEFPAWAAESGDSGEEVTHAVIPKKVAATTYRRFMVTPRVNSRNSQHLGRYQIDSLKPSEGREILLRQVS